MWRVRCECGQQKDVLGANLVKGRQVSCGCKQAERIAAVGRASKKHGHAGRPEIGIPPSPTYRSWIAMWVRCTSEKHPAYHRYGGRGIKVCDRWKSFENFLADMGERPHGLTLDRAENDDGYQKSNCRWATRSEQSRNQRRWKK
jgi:hypothetical protein